MTISAIKVPPIILFSGGPVVALSRANSAVFGKVHVRWSPFIIARHSDEAQNRCRGMRKKAVARSFFGWHRFLFSPFCNHTQSLWFIERGETFCCCHQPSGARSLFGARGQGDGAVMPLILDIFMNLIFWFCLQVTWKYSRTSSVPLGFSCAWTFCYFCQRRVNWRAVCGSATMWSQRRNGKRSDSYHFGKIFFFTFDRSRW